MNKKKIITKTSGASQTRKSIQDIKTYKINPNSNAKSKPMLKPNSAHPLSRCFQIGKSFNKVKKRKYSPNTAAQLIQKHIRLFLIKINHFNSELNEMMKQKKIEILQSYNIIIDVDLFKETSKFGVCETKDSQLTNAENNKRKEEDVEKTKNYVTKGIIKLEENIDKNNGDTTKGNGNETNDTQPKLNEDLKGLQKKFYYNEDEPNENLDGNGDNCYKSKPNENAKEKNIFIDNKENKNNCNNKENANNNHNEYDKLFREMQNKEKAKDIMNSKEDKTPIDNINNMNRSQPQIYLSQDETKTKRNEDQPSASVCIDHPNSNNEKENDNLLNISCLIKFKKKKRLNLQNASVEQTNVIDKKIKDISLLDISGIEQTNLDDKTKQCCIIDSVDAKQNNTNVIQRKVNTIEIPVITLGFGTESREKTIERLNGIIQSLKLELELNEDHSIAKEELNEKIKNHSKTIEALTKDKTEFEDRLSQIEKASYKKLQKLKEIYEEEAKKTKEAWAQNEIIKRRKWEENKIKEIKKLTERGLEHQIQSILLEHKRELEELKDKFAKEIIAKKQKTSEEYEAKLISLKIQLIKEKDEGIKYEKQLYTQRLTNQSKRLEEEITEERQRWNVTMEMELSRLETLRDKDKHLYEEQIETIEDINSTTLYSKEDSFKKHIENFKKNNEALVSNQIASVKLLLEKQNEKSLNEKQEQLEAKYDKKRHEIIEAKGNEIRLFLVKMKEEELHRYKDIQSECYLKANEKNKELIVEITLLNNTVCNLTHEIQSEIKKRIIQEELIEKLKNKFNNSDSELKKREKMIVTLNKSNTELSEKNENLIKEYNKDKVNFELEMRTEMKAKSAEIQLMKNQLLTLHKMYDNQRNEIDNAHRKEVEDIELKLTMVLKQKDIIIEQIKEDSLLKDLTIKKYEQMLKTQRVDLLSS